MDDSIAARVAALIPRGQQSRVAEAVGMTQDALSRATRGQRGFGAGELMRIADYFNEDLHYLIAGEPDPYRIVAVARHCFDPTNGHRSVPGKDADGPIIDDVVFAYRQASLAPNGDHRIPANAADARETLGDGFIRPFVERLESKLGIDVVRLAEVSTAYSMRIQGRPVIVIPATGNWFYENWSLAHELAHLGLAHHADVEGADRNELAANRYAGELLMPREEMLAIDWDSIDVRAYAALVWGLGVSTSSLAIRLETLGIESAIAQEWRNATTQKLLRRHWTPAEPGDPITVRMTDATQRRFPTALIAAHLDAIAQGKIGRQTMAWMLGIDADELDVEQPAPPEMSTSDLASLLDG